MKRILQHPVSFFMIITVAFLLLLALLFASLHFNLFWYFGGVILLIPLMGTMKYSAYVNNWRYEKTTNSLPKSIKLFEEQIGKTKNILQIFDDGNVMPGGMYHNESVMKALKNKIKQNENFKISIQFNSKPNKNSIFKLAKKFKKNIEIKHNPNPIQRKGEEVHFRISDNGRRCHISEHKWKEDKRSVISFKKPFFFDWYLFGLGEKGNENHPVFLSRSIFNKQNKSFEIVT